MPSQDTWSYIVLYGGLGLFFGTLIIAIIIGPGKKDDPKQGDTDR